MAPNPRPAARQITVRPAPRRRRPPRPIAQRHRDPPGTAPRAVRAASTPLAASQDPEALLALRSPGRPGPRRPVRCLRRRPGRRRRGQRPGQRHRARRRRQLRLGSPTATSRCIPRGASGQVVFAGGVGPCGQTGAGLTLPRRLSQGPKVQRVALWRGHCGDHRR